MSASYRGHRRGHCFPPPVRPLTQRLQASRRNRCWPGAFEGRSSRLLADTAPQAGSCRGLSYASVTGDLLISYTHSGLAAVTVTPASGGSLILLIADDDTAATIWRQDTADGTPVIVAGPALLRGASACDLGAVSLTNLGTVRTAGWRG